MKNAMLIIGDVHGKTSQYHDIVKANEGPSIQVGDFGFERSHRWHLANIDPDKHKVLFGNHDFYPLVKEQHSLGDFTVLDNGIMTIRGAQTLDKSGMEPIPVKNKDGTIVRDENGKVETRLKFYVRTEGKDLFEYDEQLSHSKGYEAFDLFVRTKPSVVITHDCPSVVREEIMSRRERTASKTITDQLLQGCFEAHQPDLWIFGHYHESLTMIMEGTRFVCLAELETFPL